MLEKEAVRHRAEILRLKDQIKELQSKSILNARNENNTSSAFVLPSEFKDKWHELASERLLDAFTPFLASHRMLLHHVRATMHSILAHARARIENRFQQLA